MSARPIYYDTETTGVRAERDRIVEIAAYDPERGESFVKLINPGCPIPLEATAIHKISDEMVLEAPPFAAVAPEFIEFCSGEVILIAHNNDTFDQLFLRNSFERIGLKMPPWRFIDSLKWSRRYRPDLPRHTLQYLREVYGIPPNNAHRAFDDVVVLHQLFSLMKGDLSIEQVHELLGRKGPQREIHHMPFGKYQGQPLSQLPKSYLTWLKGSGALEKEDNAPLKAALEKRGLLA